MKQASKNSYISRLYYVSKEGIEALRRKQKDLTLKRREISHTLADLSDQPNSKTAEDQTWADAMKELYYVENELEETQDILARARPITRPKRIKQVILGASVHLISGKKKVTYTIVSSLEANPSAGKISDMSPFGKMLLGKKVGDKIMLSRKTGKARPMTLKLAAIE